MAAFLHSSLFEGRALSPADNIFQFPFFREAAPADFQRPQNPLVSDAIEQVYPWNAVTRDALAHGELPTWNPHIFAGNPHFANGLSAILHPVNVLGYLVPLNRAFAVSAAIRLLIAGLGMMLFARGLGIGWSGAAVASAAFMLSGSMVVWLNYPLTNALCWAPLLFVLGDRLIHTRNPAYAALVSLVVASQILGGHHQTSFMMLLAWGVYCLFRLYQALKGEGGHQNATTGLALLAVGATAGFLLAAVQLLPFAEYLLLGTEAQRRLASRPFTFVDPSFWTNLPVLVTLIMPNALGNPTWGSAASFFGGNYMEQTAYTGVIPLALAAIAVAGLGAPKALSRGWGLASPAEASSERSAVRFFGILGAMSMALALRIPGVDLLNHLPVFSVVAHQRYRIIFVFCIAILAGFGVQYLARLRPDDRGVKYVQWVLFATGMLGFGCFVAGYALVHHHFERFSAYDRLRALQPVLTYGFSPERIEMYFPVVISLAAGAVILLYRRRAMPSRALLPLLSALVIADLFVFGAGFNPTVAEANTFPETGGTQFLKNELSRGGPARVVALNDDLPPNLASTYLLSDIAGADFPIRRYAELAQAAGGWMSNHYRISFARLHPGLMNLMNVRFVISSGGDLPLPDAREVYRNSAITIYENSGWMPRAYVVREAEVISDGKAILDRLSAADFDPRRLVILEESPPDTAWSGEPPKGDSVEIVTYRDTRITVRAQLRDAGFLVLADNAYPGWRAWVDGHETHLYRANYTFRAVPLTQGHHLVEFSYEPSHAGIGLAAGAVGLLLVLGLATAAARAATSGRAR